MNDTVFSKAADLIREHGWWQGASRGPDGQLCTIAAVTVAVDATDALAIEFPILQTMWKHFGRGVSDWNDQPERTVEDVLLALKELHVEAGGS